MSNVQMENLINKAIGEFENQLNSGNKLPKFSIAFDKGLTLDLKMFKFSTGCYALNIAVSASGNGFSESFPFSNSSIKLSENVRTSKKATAEIIKRLKEVEEAKQFLSSEIVSVLEKNKSNFGDYDYSSLTQ